MRNNKKIIFLLGSAIYLSSILTTAAAEPLTIDGLVADQFFVAEVIENKKSGDGGFIINQTTRVRSLSGEESSKEIDIGHGSEFSSNSDIGGVKIGEKLVVAKTQNYGETSYYLVDRYRLPQIIFISTVFIILVLIFGKLRGLTAILGLVLNILILTIFTIPQILAGKDPLTICLITALSIAFTSIYLTHGFSKRTSVAVGSTVVTFGLSALLTAFFVYLTKLSGIGTEEAFYLQVIPDVIFNFQGLLLGGIIISLMGILDDVTTSQAAAIDEIIKANPSLSFAQIYKSGLSVGKEHIASLVNTLVLIYAGASLPLLLLLSTNRQPLWFIINGEFMAEEIVRTLSGSISLVLAVPITNLLASYFLKKYPSNN